MSGSFFMPQLVHVSVQQSSVSRSRKIAYAVGSQFHFCVVLDFVVAAFASVVRFRAYLFRIGKVAEIQRLQTGGSRIGYCRPLRNPPAPLLPSPHGTAAASLPRSSALARHKSHRHTHDVGGVDEESYTCSRSPCAPIRHGAVDPPTRRPPPHGVMQPQVPPEVPLCAATVLPRMRTAPSIRSCGRRRTDGARVRLRPPQRRARGRRRLKMIGVTGVDRMSPAPKNFDAVAHHPGIAAP